MFYSPDNTDFALAVVGSANSNNCSTIIANQTSYGAYSYFPDGSDASIWDHTFPNNVNSSVEFYVQGKGSIDNNTAELPLCGVASPRNFKLIFHSTWTQNGPGAFGRKLETSFLFHDLSFRLDVAKEIASTNRFTQAFWIHWGTQAHAFLQGS
jgi:hypothetical protein